MDVSRTIAVPGCWTRQSNVCDQEHNILGVRSGPYSVVLVVLAVCDVLMQGKLSIDLEKEDDAVKYLMRSGLWNSVQQSLVSAGFAVES